VLDRRRHRWQQADVWEPYTWALLEAAGLRPRLQKVYDLVNAGPRRRFSAGGVVVSNSAYGASGASLERKAEADTGVHQDPGTGETLLRVLEERQPRAFEFMKEMEQTPDEQGYIVAASGRVRHFHTFSEDEVGWWVRKSHLSALGREARNFLMQESVAATAARAANWLLRFSRKFSLKGYPIAVLYDSVVTLCPCEEREIWAKAHEVFMHLANGWKYEDRILRYPVDHELNKCWSAKASPEERAAIDSVPLLDTENVRAAQDLLDSAIEILGSREKLSTRGAEWILRVA